MARARESSSLNKAAAISGERAPASGWRRPAIGNQAKIQQFTAYAAAVGAESEQLRRPELAPAASGNEPKAGAKALGASKVAATAKSKASSSKVSKSASSATSVAAVTGRTIRISGWPTPVTIYGTFSAEVEASLADGWLSRIEIDKLDLRPVVGSGSPKDDRDRLFRWLTGYYPGTGGFSAHDPDHKATYLSLGGYEDLPARMNVGSHSPNRYLHWLAGGEDWATVTTLNGLNLMARSMFAQINAEPDIAPDDKAELIRLHYLRALANTNITWGPAGPRIDLTIAGTNYAPLTTAQVAAFRSQDGRTIKHLRGLRSWINTFQVSGAVGIFAIR